MHGKVKMSSYDIPDEPELNRLTDFFKVLGDPTRVKILSTTPILALSAGTKEPICAIRTISAVCRI